MKPTIWEFVAIEQDEVGLDIRIDMAMNVDRIDAIICDIDDRPAIICAGHRWIIGGDWTFRDLVDRWKARRSLSNCEGQKKHSKLRLEEIKEILRRNTQ